MPARVAVVASPSQTPTPTQVTISSSQPSFDEIIDGLDTTASASVIPALRAFATHHSSPGVPEAVRYHALQRLLALFEVIENGVQVRMQRDSDFEAAMMAAIGEDAGHPTPGASAQAAVRGHERDGLRFYRVDGALVHIDHATFERLAAPGLSAAARLFLDAVQWDAEHTTRMQGDDPADLVKAIEQWERLIDLGAPYERAARSHATADLELYLTLCGEGYDESPVCRVTPALRHSYAEFVREHPDSRFKASVETFLRAASARRFSFTTDEAILSAAKALTMVATKRPVPYDRTRGR